jgi:hypothetical protein
LAAVVSRPDLKVHHRIHTLEALAEHLQWALSVELSTIPPYLTALYSVEVASDPAATIMRSVVLEEMLHMLLAANLLNAIGYQPSLGPDDIVRYPCYMPHHAAGGPFLQLQPLSAELAEKVFMAIEQPELSPHAPAEGEQYSTIGQFYKAVEEGFEICVEELGPYAVFGHDTGSQHSDVYIGGGAGNVRLVDDLESAKRAITEITQQGEGAKRPRPPIPGEEPFGGRDFYGRRPDGAYGPIIGIPWELSHYRKFQQLATEEVQIPRVHPMIANPSPAMLSGPARGLAELFDHVYTAVLKGLQDLLTHADPGPSFFGLAFPLMQEVMPALARLLMQTPLQPEADPALGPTAGPAFLWSPRPLPDLVALAESLRDSPPDLGTGYAKRWRQALERLVAVLTPALKKAVNS